jgi:hypothetical protein
MAGFKTQTKRTREAAKLAKRQAKDQKRAARKAERAGSAVAAVPAVTPATGLGKPAPLPGRHAVVQGTAPVAKPLTLAEAVERWKGMKVAKPKRY